MPFPNSSEFYRVFAVFTARNAHFAKNYQKFIDTTPFKVEQASEKGYMVVVTFPNDKYNEFFNSLDGIQITKFIEKPFTLQDYFMSFYKEEKTFGGLSGVEGNTKEGIKK